MWPCPLCRNENTHLHFEDKKRSLYFCPNCYLVFVPKKYHCSTEKEKERYDTHNNHPQNETYSGYESWMKNFLEWSSPREKILDYGCGPNPILAFLLKAKGIDCDSYDPNYFPREDFLQKGYDSLLVSEVVEHFRSPLEEWTKLLLLLNLGGSLYIRTSFWNEEKEWKNWSYQRDFTHVTFYHFKTLVYLSEYFSLELIRFESDKAEFRRVKS